MSDLHDLVDPEARALLNEVAQDPRSTILRKDRTMQMAQAVANGEDLWITRKTGLTSAERQLLEVWRDEAAFLLRLAHYEGFGRAGTNYSRGMYFLGDRNRERELGEDELLIRLKAMLGRFSEQTQEHQAIRSVIQDFTSFRREMAWLATASLRIAPSHAGQAYVGDELLVAGDTHSARQVFERLATAPLQRHMRGTVEGTLSTVYSLLEQHDEALYRVKAAAKARPSSATFSFSWLMQAAKQGNGEEVRLAIEHVDARWDGSESAIEVWTRTLSAQDTDNTMMSRLGVPTISALSPVASSASGRILDGLLEFAGEVA